jgi:hypothetical protein
MIATMIDRYVIGRECNVVRVDFSRSKPEPPGPTFPGAGALRSCAGLFQPVNAAATALRIEAA